MTSRFSDCRSFNKKDRPWQLSIQKRNRNIKKQQNVKYTFFYKVAYLSVWKRLLWKINFWSSYTGFENDRFSRTNIQLSQKQEFLGENGHFQSIPRHFLHNICQPRQNLMIHPGSDKKNTDLRVFTIIGHSSLKKSSKQRFFHITYRYIHIQKYIHEKEKNGFVCRQARLGIFLGYS